ncbi:MAG: nicotinamide mononucleotide transporter [Erysipelotrichaceae bacterium]|nr:nicotinamide mononucleotide transporter [Erysipelotrichaceae bacterium]
MRNFFRDRIESDRTVRTIEIISLIALIVTSIVSFSVGTSRLNSYSGPLSYLGTIEMERLIDEEDYDEGSTVCDVIYVSDEMKMIVSYPYEEYIELEDVTITAYRYQTENGLTLCFPHQDPTETEARDTYRQIMAENTVTLFNLASSTFILFISVAVMLLFGNMFTTYEKCWFVSIMALSTVFGVLFPEEDANGVNGIIIMLLYLLDTLFNILCELLISKQSRYNFLVSVLVEIIEIAICIVLMYRFATMVVTLFFWLPIDILSFINWSRHKDDEEDELTKVRRLKGYQELLIILAIVVWTVVVGYFLSGLDIRTDFFNNNERLQTAITYIDACASAVGVANGLFIFFRLREQWIAWYICAALEAVINILSGQYVLLILKLGYFTNTTYGYIKWSRYIAQRNQNDNTLF